MDPIHHINSSHNYKTNPKRPTNPSPTPMPAAFLTAAFDPEGELAEVDDEPDDPPPEEPPPEGEVEVAEGVEDVAVAVPLRRSALRAKPSRVAVLLSLALITPTPPSPQVAMS